VPFAFDFYGVAVTTITIGANGGLFATAAQAVPVTNGCLVTSDVAGRIFPLQDDLNPTTGGSLYTQTHGSAPNRVFVVEWADVPRYSAVGDSTFEVQFHESDGHLEFHYTDVLFGDAQYDYGASATTGIAGSGGFLDVNCNTAGLSDSYAVAFYPPGEGGDDDDSTPAPDDDDAVDDDDSGDDDDSTPAPDDDDASSDDDDDGGSRSSSRSAGCVNISQTATGGAAGLLVLGALGLAVRRRR